MEEAISIQNVHHDNLRNYWTNVNSQQYW